MLKAAAALAFYARFFVPFSTIGHRRRVAAVPAPPFDFRGQRWWVTGATGGIGRAIALGALAGGAEVNALARDAGKLAALRADAGTLAGATARGGDASTRLRERIVDLSSVRAVERLADESTNERIHTLVHNVGVMLHAFRRTDEGVEASFATNLLAPFAMTSALRRSGALDANSLIISMSSGGAYGAKLDLDALEATDAAAHDGFMAYAQHKRAQIELTRAWNADAAGPRALVMHPGWVDTDGVRSSLPGFRRTLKSHLRTAEQGADTALWLAATRPAPHPDGGLWLDRHRDDEHAFAMTRGGASAAALVAHLERRLATIV